MQLDTVNQSIFDETDIFNLIYQDNIAGIANLPVVNSPELTQFTEISQILLSQYVPIHTASTIDESHQLLWFMPNSYYELDILEYCISQCNNDLQIARVCEEYVAFEQKNMIRLLQWCKYFVDNCIINDILWGVGRGSSVASYVLYLIGIHRIDSMKYQLDWKEFLKP